jgi:hypothetical protein
MTDDGVEGEKDLGVEFPAPAADAAGVGAHHHPQLVWGRRQPGYISLLLKKITQSGIWSKLKQREGTISVTFTTTSVLCLGR